MADPLTSLTPREQLRIQLVATLKPELGIGWGLREIVALVNGDLLPIIDAYVESQRAEIIPTDPAEGGSE